MPQPQAQPRLMLWSVPRSRSTAFFRMMAERGDFSLLHEPFSYLVMYGHTEVGGTSVGSEPELVKALVELPGPVFAKETTGVRYPEVLRTPEFLDGWTHTFLIRDPRETIPSYLRITPDAWVASIGFELMHEIYTAVAQRTGRQPVLIDAADLMRDPAGTVKAYCAATGIPFLPQALSWRPAHLPEWEPSRRWHESVAGSTGLGTVAGDSAAGESAAGESAAGESAAGESAAVPDAAAAPYLRHHRPYYEALYARRLAPA